MKNSMVCHSIPKKSAGTTNSEEHCQNYQTHNLATFSTTIVWGHTKLKGHGMKLNLIAESSENNQLPPCGQCTPTYCNLETRFQTGLQQVLGMFQQNKLQYHLGQLYVKYSWPIWYPKFRPQKDRNHQRIKRRIILGFLIS